MDYLIIGVIIAQIFTIGIIIIGFLRIANLVAAATNALLEHIGPIAQITENIAGLPEDFDPFQHGIKQIILEKLQQAMKPGADLPIKEYNRADNGKFSSSSSDITL